MWQYNYNDANTLYHHGILGQRWGKRNGPPYPLEAYNHSASEKRAGWRKSLDKGTKKGYNKTKDNNKKDHQHLTDNQKKAIKIGAAAVVTALALYGTYKLAKSGKLDDLIDIGKNKAAELFDRKSGNASGIIESGKNTTGGLKRLAQPESLSDTLKKTNPNLGNSFYDNNCTFCSVAGFLRRRGYDVTAKSTGGKQRILNGVVENCFKNATVIDGSAIKFGRSRKDAAEMLLKRFGQNAEGVCCIQWKNSSGGHAFNWMIEDGIVSFFDAQNGWDDATVSRLFWSKIDPQGYLQLARLDNAEIILEAIIDCIE